MVSRHLYIPKHDLWMHSPIQGSVAATAYVILKCIVKFIIGYRIAWDQQDPILPHQHSEFWKFKTHRWNDTLQHAAKYKQQRLNQISICELYNGSRMSQLKCCPSNTAGIPLEQTSFSITCVQTKSDLMIRIITATCCSRAARPTPPANRQLDEARPQQQ